MKAIFTYLFFSIVLLGFGQNTFKVRAFSPQYAYLDQVAQLNDGSFVSFGDFFNNEFNADGYLVKTDSKGVVLASKALKGVSGNSIIKTNDGGFAVCGDGELGLELVKFKADFTVQWQKEYAPAEGGVLANKMIQTTDGGFLIAGAKNTTTSDSDGVAGYVIKTDATGSLEFAKRYLDYNSNYIADVVATTDGNYALLCETEHSDIAPDSTFLIKIKPDGSIIWSRSLSGSKSQQSVNPYGFSASSDNGLVICGDIYTNSSGFRMAMTKFDNTGNLLWSQSIGVPDGNDIFGDGVIEDKDGGYLFHGALESYKNGTDTAYGYIAKTNASGALQWTKEYQPNNDDYVEFYNLIKTSDGGYAVCGDGDFLNPNNQEYDEGGFIYKLDENFQGCNDRISSEGTIQSTGTSTIINVASVNINTTVTDVSASLSDAGTIDNVCSSNVLPLQLLSFTAALQNKNVAVQWTTANEVNTSYFVVEKSKDAVAFTALQQVAAKGISTSVQTYTITDLQPLPGTSYYRLKEVDKDGKVTYSSVVPVTVVSNGAIIISPNPVQNTVKIFVQSQSNSGIALQITDMAGRILAAKNTYVTTGANTISLPATSLSKGVYILKVRENNQTKFIKFLKK